MVRRSTKRVVKGRASTKQKPLVSLYDAKTYLSDLVDRAAAGEEIVITKNGVPLAKLIGVPFQGEQRRPAHALGLKQVPENFDDPLPPDIQRALEGLD